MGQFGWAVLRKVDGKRLTGHFLEEKMVRSPSCQVQVIGEVILRLSFVKTEAVSETMRPLIK